MTQSSNVDRLHPGESNKLDTHSKALKVNLDRRRYGTFAEIGAGQEVVRWFFRVGGAAGTIAKSMSAYDMAVSDAIYGPCDRYVSRTRLESMLDHEYRLNIDRLGPLRGETTSFFAFANTVSARNFQGTNECHGWMGVRFQIYPGDQQSQIIIHVRMLDNENLLQQEALGIVGVNLLFGAFFLHHEPEQLVESLLDNLSTQRIEIDMIEFSGIGFRTVDNRLMSLKLVQLGLSKAAMFDATGKVLQPSEVFHKRPILVERGSFRPVTTTNLDMLRCAKEQFAKHLPDEDKGRVVAVTEITMRNLQTTDNFSTRDFLARADMLGACGSTVLVSDYFEYYRLAAYLNSMNKGKRIGLVMGVPSLMDLFDPAYYKNLEGGILESFGRLFKNELKLLIYPYKPEGVNDIQTAANLTFTPDLQKLFGYLMDNNCIFDLANYDPACLPIFSRDVLRRIACGDLSWEAMVPPPVAKIIRERKLLGYKAPQPQ